MTGGDPKHPRLAIIALKDHRFKKMKKGHFACYIAKASMAFLVKTIREHPDSDYRELRDVERQWVHTGANKLLYSVSTEEELMDIYYQAEKAGLEVHQVLDDPANFWKEKRHVVCIVIGPDWTENICPLTNELDLY